MIAPDSAMTPKRRLTSYLVAAALAVALCLAWYGLNRLRVHYYEGAAEIRRGQSPYVLIIRGQVVVMWLALLAFAYLVLGGIYDMVHWLAARISPQRAGH